MTEFTKTLDQVVSELRTIEIGVDSLDKKKELTPTQLKLFYTVLKRTKTYVEAAKDLIDDAERFKWNALYYEGGD